MGIDTSTHTRALDQNSGASGVDYTDPNKRHLLFVLSTLGSLGGNTSCSREYRISGVPEIIIVGADGIVEKTWVGELTIEDESEIEHLMSAAVERIN